MILLQPASFSNEARLLLALIIWEWVTIVAQRHFGDIEINIIDINCYEGGTSFDAFYHSASALSDKLLPFTLEFKVFFYIQGPVILEPTYLFKINIIMLHEK